MEKRYDGKAEYVKKSDKWKISAPPHILMKLKRLFVGSEQKSYGVISISASEENSKDLEWFSSRYNLEFSDPNILESKVKAYDDRINSINQILDGKRANDNFDLAIPLREYQKVPSQIVLSSFGLLLADDLGLGKTAQAIALFARPDTRPAMVISPSHLTNQWEREIKKFAPGLTTHILKKSIPYPLVNDRNFPDVIITNYFKMKGWTGVLSGVVKTVVFDECQELRRSESDKYVCATSFAKNAVYRMGLSATPIYNVGLEFYNVINTLSPGVLGTQDEFRREWCHEDGRIKDPKTFGSFLRSSGVMLRRTREETKNLLPGVSKTVISVDHDTESFKNAKDQCTALAELILYPPDEKVDQRQIRSEFSMVMRKATGLSKAKSVATYVKMFLESEPNVILFGWHRDVYDIWLRELSEFKPVLYTGTESVREKERSRDEFISGRSRVMIISLRSGSGLDGLQEVCRNIVFGELDWSPGVHNQCIGRLYRDNQKDTVFCYFLVSDEGSDPTIMDVLGMKNGQIQGVMNNGSDLLETNEIDPNHVKTLAVNYLSKRQ